MTSPEHDQALAAVPLFAGLSKRQRSRMVDASRVVQHGAGREIATEDEGALALHVILEGAATVSKGGVERRTLGAGDYFGEISMIDGKRRSATVTAAEPLTTLAVPHLAFQSMLDDDPTMAREMLKVLCARLREAESED